MSVESLNELMEIITHWTLCLVCTGLWLILIAGVWKWFFGVMKKGACYIFPDLNTWIETLKKKFKK